MIRTNFPGLGLLAALSLLVSVMPAAAADEPSAALRKTLERILPVDDYAVAPSPIPGFSEVSFSGQVLYVSDDGRYAFQGDLYDLVAERSLTEERRSEQRRALLGELEASELVIFAPEKAPARHVVHVFTDVDCTYCRRLHSEIDEYNRQGIEVRYLAFPRSGADSPLYDKMVSVWCAEDPRRALTRAKAGEPVPPAACAGHPVRHHLDLANAFSVTGTPATVLPDGSVTLGYVPPAHLAAMLEEAFPDR